MWFLVVFVCSSVYICYADNIKTIQANIYKDVSGELKCEVNASELNSTEINESFQVYVIGPEHENMDIYGGSCYRTSDPIEPIHPNFWKMTKTNRSRYVSTNTFSVTRSGSEYYTCNVYTKECKLESGPTFNCFYTDTNGVDKPDKAIKCDFVINVKPAGIKKENIIFILAAVCVTAFLLIIGIVWGILHLINRRKRMPPHSHSLEMYYENYPQRNEDSRPVPAQLDPQNNCVYAVPNVNGNIEAMYSKPAPKHQGTPKVKPLSQVRSVCIVEPTNIYVQNTEPRKASKKIEPIYAQPGKENEYRNMRDLKSKNADVIYNNLYHT